jgi:branched-chain amino acid transport system ATP-binding protein
VLRIKGLSAAYGAVAALRGIDLEIAPGEVVAMIGSNGAGKSTALKAISGLIRPTEGEIVFEGQPIAGLRADEIVARGIVHVPEGRHIFPRLSVEQNLQVGAYSPRAHAGEKTVREEVYALFPRLYERRRQAGGSLSGGEQQMLAFGRAMMANPLLLLLDEPSLGLAPIVVEEVANAIRHFQKSGVTILLVEQNAELALELAQRGYVIESGRIVLSGLSASLLDNPQVWATYLGQEEWEFDDSRLEDRPALDIAPP